MAHKYGGIFGWCNFQDIYDEACGRYDNALFVEVGSFQGQSACYMGEIIKERGKNNKLIAVDLFPTEDEIQNQGEIGAGQSVEKDIIRQLPDSLMNTFVKNMRNAEVDDVIIPIKSDSIKASSIFPDEHFEFVFLDDCHYHDYVVEELEHWWPKVKKGGMYGGHDYDDKGVGDAVREFAKKHSLNIVPRLASWLIYK